MAFEWIRHNILSFDRRRNWPLMEAESKVQQSIEKFSIPDLNLNKRPKPPKILKIIPIEYRLPSWKSLTTRRNSTSNSSSFDSIDISPYVKENVKENTKEVASPITSHKSKIFCQQMLPKTKNTRSSTKSSPKEEVLDVNTSMMKLRRKIFNTFPKMSPSRKTQNINLVLPPGPKIELSKDIEDMCNDDYNDETSVLKERPFNVDSTTQTEGLINVDVIINKRENGQKNLSFRRSQVVTTPSSSTLDVEPNFFTYRVKSTPKFSQVSDVETTPSRTSDVEPKCFTYSSKRTPKFSQASDVETTPSRTSDVRPKCFTYPSKRTPKFSQASGVETTPSSTPDVQPKFFKHPDNSTPKFSQSSGVVTTPSSTLDVEPNFFTYRVKSTPKFSQVSDVETTPSRTSDVEPKCFTYSSKRTPKFSQASGVETTPSSTPHVRRKLLTRRARYAQKFPQAHLFSSAIIEEAPKEKIVSPSLLQKSLIFENKSKNVSNKSENIRRPKKISPNILERTFIFERSSTHSSFQDTSNPVDLELPLRSKQFHRKKSIVREIVRDFDEEVKKSLHPRHSEDDKERFVKQIVNALKKRDISGIRNLSSRSSINDEDSPSESETKSHVTSCSPKDTDYSDYNRRSPDLNSDYVQTFNFKHPKEDTLKDEEKKEGSEDDTVHWISIPRCTLPRSSSPLSMASISSTRDQSPDISPIKSPNAVEYSLQTSWGAIYKTSNPLCKKLFRETVVIDSGYAD